MDETQLRFPEFWENSTPIAADSSLQTWAKSRDELEKCVLFQTSGSTSAPKWLALPKDGLLLSAAVVNRHLEVSPASVWALTLPTHHVGGFGVVARAYEAACQCARFPQKWNAVDFTSWAHHQKISHVSLVPTQIFDLVAAQCYAPPTIRAVVVGGGALDTALGQQARELRWPVLASFGMTEAGSQIATQSLHELSEPFQNQNLSKLAHWQWRSDEDKLLQLSGPSLFSATILREANDWKLTPRLEDWYVTQDRVELHGNFLTALGRNSLQIKILGELINLEVLDQQFLTITQLSRADAALVALPDPRRGNRIGLAICQHISPEKRTLALRAFHEQQPSLTHISQIFDFPALPISPLGKLQRATLDEWCAAYQTC